MACGVAAVMISSCASEPTLMERAEALQRSIVTLDTHVDTPMSLLNPNFDVTKWGTGCVDFPKMKAGALGAECFAVYTSQKDDEGYADAMYAKALRLFDTIQHIVASNPETVKIVSKPSDFAAIHAEGKLAIMPTVENSVILGEDISRVDVIYGKGARMIGLCHSYNNVLCDSSSDKRGPVFNGLSPFGEEVVTRLNELGAIIDVSHASDETVFDVFKLSKCPIAASHSSCRAIANKDRNFSDEMLEGLKANGGVIQICILDSYVTDFPENEAYAAEMAEARSAMRNIDINDSDARTAARAKMTAIKAKYPDQNTDVAAYVDHIDYAVKKIGIDHVGIGTDFDGGGGVTGCKDVSEMVNVTAELIKRGYSDEDIAKIWGLNFIRVFEQCVAYAESLK